ncbi:MAG: hypothetical protein ACP5SG_08325, partial [Dissulfurimicrobium sp.]|uniref:hypothetical protein n=1 Tax=Dissulfurimicrobium sp. TaxID=2022436 RepID=UPI003D121287
LYHILFIVIFTLTSATQINAAPMGPGTNPGNPGIGTGGMPIFHMPDRPWMKGPNTFDMAGPVSELNSIITNTALFSGMAQEPNGTIFLYSKQPGHVFAYMVPETGFNASQTAGTQGPSIHFGPDGSLIMVTSHGTFTAMPYFHNVDDFEALVDSAFGMQITMTYQADGSFIINYPGLPYGFSLRPDPEAVFGDGTDTAGLKLPPGLTDFSPFSLRYTDGFSQNFRPAFAHADEVMAGLGKLPGMSNIQMNADGSISVTWTDGQVSYRLTLMSSMVVSNADTTNITPGFSQSQDGSWWYTYANGLMQRFRIEATLGQ